MPSIFASKQANFKRIPRIAVSEIKQALEANQNVKALSIDIQDEWFPEDCKYPLHARDWFVKQGFVLNPRDTILATGVIQGVRNPIDVSVEFTKPPAHAMRPDKEVQVTFKVLGSIGTIEESVVTIRSIKDRALNFEYIKAANNKAEVDWYLIQKQVILDLDLPKNVFPCDNITHLGYLIKKFDDLFDEKHKFWIDTNNIEDYRPYFDSLTNVILTTRKAFRASGWQYDEMKTKCLKILSSKIDTLEAVLGSVIANTNTGEEPELFKDTLIELGKELLLEIDKEMSKARAEAHAQHVASESNKE